jgi:ABC-2 type transport system ATP-binding protein
VSLALAFGKRPELLLLDEPMADIDPLARHELTGALMADVAERGTTIVMSSHVVAELDGACDYLLLLGSRRIRLGGDHEGILDAHRVLTGLRGDFGPHAVIEEYEAGRGRTALVRTVGEVGGVGEVAAGEGAGEGAGDGAAEPDDEPGREPELREPEAESGGGPESEPESESKSDPGPESGAGSLDARSRGSAEWTVEAPTLEELLLGYLRNPDAPDLLLADAVPVGAETAARQEVAV